jgi:hypothetical protein
MPSGMTLPLALSLALLLAVPAVGRAAEGDIDSDRPGFTNSANPVGRGVIQLEGGLAFTKTSLGGVPDERRFSLQATLRVGLLENLELRLDGEPFVALRGADDASGFGDVTLGLKWRLYDPPKDSLWPALGVLPFVKINTARSPIGSERPDGGVVGLASFDFPTANLFLDVNVGGTAVGQEDDSPVYQAVAGASLGTYLTPRLRVGVEFFFQSKEERTSRDQAVIQMGVSYLVTRDFALDGAVGTSVIGQAPDYFVQAGMSVRFGR